MQEFCKPDVCMEIVEHDRISSLPDEVLTHILSFLSTKEAVYTCVLSKTWRKIWATVPNLNFSSCEFLMDDLDGDEGRKSGARFERFVRGVLDNRESTNLDIVHYSREIHGSETLVSMEWLDRVALLMPRVIHIHIDGNFYGVDLPDLIFSCASLQRLVMKFCYDCMRPIIEPMSIYLPSLKVLRLNRVELPYDFPQILFMGCPSLERLYLCFCALHFSSISSMKLKKFRLDACDQYEEIQISCPNLVSLFITCDVEDNFLGISLNDMTSLVNATVKLYYFDYGDEVPVLNLFGGLSNATNLKLPLVYPNLKGQLEKDILNWRKFNNLKKLCIGILNISCDIYLIACFLKHSPNLKELTLELFASPGDIQQEPRQEVLGDVSFQHEYLETVKIKCWSNSEWASNLIKTLDKYVKKIGNIIIR